jgi:uncharacterized membrane protein
MKKVAKDFWQRIIRYFLAGVFAILPLVITIAIVGWVAQFIDSFVGPDTVVGQQLKSLGLRYASTSSQILAYAIGWIIVLGVVFCLGVAIELGAKQLFQRFIDGVLSRVPLLGNVYATSKQVVQMLDKKDDEALKGMSAVFCFFGERHGAGFLALLVSPDKYKIRGLEYQAVIIPTAPVPFGGGLIFVPADSVHSADMSVDGLMSIYVSMGVTANDYLASDHDDPTADDAK